MKRKLCGTFRTPLTVPNHPVDLLRCTTPHPRDAHILFEEEGHCYQVQFGTTFEKHGILSVSTLIGGYFPHFDADCVIRKMMQRPTFNRTVYAGMTSEVIKRYWEENASNASSCGTAFHAIVEAVCNGYILCEKEHLEDAAIKQWVQWKTSQFDAEGYIPFRTELRMYSDARTRVVGTIDLLAVKQNHAPPQETNGVLTLHIFDWKNSKEIKMRPFNDQHGTGVLSHLVDTNFEHYALQQSMYKWLLESYYKEWTWNGQRYTTCIVETIRLVVCHENHGVRAVIVDIPDRSSEIAAMIDVQIDFVSKIDFLVS
jgi:hypothetical protein